MKGFDGKNIIHHGSIWADDPVSSAAVIVAPRASFATALGTALGTAVAVSEAAGKEFYSVSVLNSSTSRAKRRRASSTGSGDVMSTPASFRESTG